MHRLGRRPVLAALGGAVTAGLAGCGDDAEASVPPEERGPLEVVEFAFAAGEPSSFGEFEPQPEATYAAGDTVWLYTELDGLAASPTSGEDSVQVDLEQRVTLDGPGDERLLDDAFEYDPVLAPARLERFFVTNDFDLAPATPDGSYDVAVTFVDRVSGTEADASSTFLVEA